MLFDPRSFVPAVDAGQPAWTPARQHPVAKRRPAHDFLTLPAIPEGTPSRALLTFGDEVDVKDLVIEQFKAGVLNASHVSNASGAGDAFAQAFHAWLATRVPTTKALSFDFALVDQAAVDVEISEFGFDMQDRSSLYLGIRLEEETVYTLTAERADALRQLDPSLVHMTFNLIRAAACKSLHVRTPDDLLDMFGRWHWDYETLGRHRDVCTQVTPNGVAGNTKAPGDLAKRDLVAQVPASNDAQNGHVDHSELPPVAEQDSVLHVGQHSMQITGSGGGAAENLDYLEVVHVLV